MTAGIEDGVLKDAIAKAVAAQILSNLTQEHRDQFMVRSLTAALEEWQVTRSIEEVVAEEAKRVAADMVKEQDWQDQITSAVDAGLRSYLLKLPAAVEAALTEAMNGREGKDSYDRAGGLVLKHLRGIQK